MIKKLLNFTKRLETLLNYFIRDRDEFEHQLSIATMVMDEGPYLREWIEYHKLVGVEKFYIYDNYSTDNIKDVLRPYIASEEVEYRLFPEKEIHSLETKRQCYNDAIKRSRNKTKWLGIIDVDEFIIPINGNSILSVIEDIKSNILSNKTCPAIGIYWVLYGYSGNWKKPNGLVIENYTRNCDKNKLGVLPKEFDWIRSEHVKSIVNPRMVIRYKIHSGEYLFNSTTKDELGNRISKTAASTKYIRINHYWTKSHEEFSSKFTKNHKYLYNRGSDASPNSQKYAQVLDYDPYFLSDKEDTIMEKYIPLLKEIM